MPTMKDGVLTLFHQDPPVLGHFEDDVSKILDPVTLEKIIHSARFPRFTNVENFKVYPRGFQ